MLKMARLNRIWICLDLETGRVFTSRTIKGMLQVLKERHCQTTSVLPAQ